MQVHLNACRPAVGAFARHEVRRADWDKQPNRQSIQVLLIGGVLPSLNRAFPYRIVPLRRQQAQYVTLAVGAALRMRPGGGLPTRGGRLQSRGSLLERWIALQGRLDAAQEPFQHGDMQPGCLRIVATGGDFQSPVSAFQHEPAAPVQGCAPVPIRIARDVRLQRIEDRRPQHAGERLPVGLLGSAAHLALRQPVNAGFRSFQDCRVVHSCRPPSLLSDTNSGFDGAQTRSYGAEVSNLIRR